MSNRHRTRLLIADDHTLVAEACKNLLEPEFEVVGIVDNGRALLQQVRELKPEVVILDIAMPQLNGLDAGDQIKRLLPATKLVYLTMNVSPEVAAEAFRRGASAYVVKHAAASELITAVRRAIRSKRNPLCEGEEDYAPAERDSATACRGDVDEGSCQYLEPKTWNRRFPQVPNHADFGSEKQCGTTSVRHPASLGRLRL